MLLQRPDATAVWDLCMTLSTYGLSVLFLARIAGVHVATARRWKRAGRVPSRYAKIIALATTGDLGTLATPWTGFRLADNKIWTPEGDHVTPGEIRSIPFRRQQLADLARQLREPQQLNLL